MVLDFCPFEADPGHPTEFKKISFKHKDIRYDLGYELRFIHPYTWDNLQQEVSDAELLAGAVLQTKTSGETNPLQERYDDISEHFLIVGRERGSRQTRQKKFWDLVEKHRRILEEADSADSEEDDDTADENYYLNYEDQGDGTYRFWLQNVYGDTTAAIMYALPCCPSCYHVLPKGWFNPEYKKFMAVGMLGAPKTGKTTLLYSMIADNFKKISEAPQWTFSHSGESAEEPVFYKMLQDADTMCNDYGSCPLRTDEKHWTEPVFIEVEHGESGNKFFLGIYDASGENQNYGSGQHTQQIHGCFDAIINLLQPESLSCYYAPEPEEAREEPLVNTQDLEAHLNDIAAQGALQRDAGETHVSLLDLVQRQPVHPGNNNLDSPFKFLHSYMLRVRDAAKKQYIAFTLVKCDKLRSGLDHPDEAKRIDESIRNMIPLDQIDLQISFLNRDNRAESNEIIRELMTMYMTDGERYIRTFERKFQAGCSYHCVSALGCDTTPVEGEKNQLVGKYKPICVAEPLLACLEAWYDKQVWGND